jgi:tRNA pseudouridine55 synthase
MRGILRQRRIGHAGTLDPEAEGLLIVLVGKHYTKQAGDYSKLDKTYQFDIKLGEFSSTDDQEGEKTKVSDIKPTKARLAEVIKALTGEISQTPPIYSAIKIGGQRAYKLARKGQTPDMPSREVSIAKFEIISYHYPNVSLKADVSSGTYIRSLARTIGEELKTGAYCTKIVRTRIGQYKLSDSLVIE